MVIRVRLPRPAGDGSMAPAAPDGVRGRPFRLRQRVEIGVRAPGQGRHPLASGYRKRPGADPTCFS